MGFQQSRAIHCLIQFLKQYVLGPWEFEHISSYLTPLVPSEGHMTIAIEKDEPVLDNRGPGCVRLVSEFDIV